VGVSVESSGLGIPTTGGDSTLVYSGLQTVEIQVGSMTTTDIAGFPIFARGHHGSAHVLAHHFLDQGAFEEGYQTLRPVVPARAPADPSELCDWTHLHWHLLVFELETGRHYDAYRRFVSTILVSALRADAARTDAPSAMWLLDLQTQGRLPLPWELVAAVSRQRGSAGSSSFVKMHDLLVFAGARSRPDLERWLRKAHTDRELRPCIPFAEGLIAAASGGAATTSEQLSRALASLALSGCSHGQRRIFEWIAAKAVALSAAIRSDRGALFPPSGASAVIETPGS